MATLTIPNLFVAGTPALASEVNANFSAVQSWSNGGIDYDNMATFSGPLGFNIGNGNAITIQNNGNDESIKITQGALLGASKASILITDNQTQTAVDSAELKMLLSGSATIPAIHILHNFVDTFKLTRTALNIGSAVTTTLGGPLVLNNPSVTGNVSLTGKETINRTSTNQFLELANTTTAKSLTVTPQTASFDLNINDVASSYQFQIDGVTKAVVDNSGLDGSYLKTNSVSTTALTTAGLVTGTIVNQYNSRSSGGVNTQPTTGSVVNTLYSTSISDLVNGKPILISIAPNSNDNNYVQNSVIYDTNDPGMAPGGDSGNITFYSALRIKINGNIVGRINSAYNVFSATNASTTDNYQTQINTVYGGYSAMVLSPITGIGTLTIELETNIVAALGHSTATLSGGFYGSHAIIIAPIR